MEIKTLGDISKGRDNNLALVKLIAAILVIYSHSYPITGHGEDLISRISNGQMGWGSFAVSIFFFYGGFLIMKSAERRNTFGGYFKARCLRIFPQLWMVVLACVFVVGPIFTSLSPGDYFSDFGTWKYLLNGVFVLVHELPGVFTNNIYGATVNGPLWTLPVEFICYILCFIYFKLGLAKEKKTLIAAPIVFIGGIGAWLILASSPLLQSMFRPMMFFFIGMAYYILRDKIRVRLGIVIIALALMIISLVFGFYFVAIYLTLPYILVYVGFGLPFSTDKWMRHFEVSYGAYLTAWPVQQILMSLTGGMSQMLNFLIATFVALILGFVMSKADGAINKLFK
ncbi:MAG: acyltransferase [Eubacterium sp.]|nr:acyltransferase [Eubacterium sp.]